MIEPEHNCPVCHPPEDWDEMYYVDVGASHYTPSSFVREAVFQGVSKRVGPNYPPDIIGKWVLLGHPHAVPPVNPGDPPRKGVFYAFRVQAVVHYLDEEEYNGMTRRRREEYEERGVALVPVPDGDDRYHTSSKRRWEKEDLIEDNRRQSTFLEFFK